MRFEHHTLGDGPGLLGRSVLPPGLRTQSWEVSLGRPVISDIVEAVRDPRARVRHAGQTERGSH